MLWYTLFISLFLVVTVAGRNKGKNMNLDVYLDEVNQLMKNRFRGEIFLQTFNASFQKFSPKLGYRWTLDDGKATGLDTWIRVGSVHGSKNNRMAKLKLATDQLKLHYNSCVIKKNRKAREKSCEFDIILYSPDFKITYTEQRNLRGRKCFLISLSDLVMENFVNEDIVTPGSRRSQGIVYGYREALFSMINNVLFQQLVNPLSSIGTVCRP